MKTVYYTDEHTNEFSTAQIKAIPIDEHYRYGHLTTLFCLMRFLYYRVFAMPIALFYLKMRWHHRIIRSSTSAQFRSGDRASRSTRQSHACRPVFIYGNHTQPMADALIPTFVAFPRSTFVIVHANNVSIPGLWQSTKLLGALPLPDTPPAARNFMAAIKERAESGSAICIYPEAHIWPYCTWVRDFPDVSFRYPVQYDAPVYCFTNTYQRRGKGVALITYVDGPFYPDAALPPKERRKALRDAVYQAMTGRAAASNAEVIRYVKAKSKTAM